MPVTLAQAAMNTTTALDRAAINEFRTSPILDMLVFDDAVSAGGAGATLTYGYTRVKTTSTAGFRAINAEYAPTEATKTQETAHLKPLGGAFQIDRVLDRVAAGAETAFQMRQKIAATRLAFADAAINGDSATNPDGFDGLSKMLAGSSTEVNASSLDVSAPMSEAQAWAVLDVLDQIAAQLDGAPTAVIAHTAFVAKVRSAARRVGQWTQTPTVLVGGQQVYQYTVAGVQIVDAGVKPGGTQPIIPVKTDGTTDVYAVRVGLDGLHGVSMAGRGLVQTWAPDFSRAGAVKTGEVEMGPVSLALKATKAAAVARGVKVRPAA